MEEYYHQLILAERKTDWRDDIQVSQTEYVRFVNLFVYLPRDEVRFYLILTRWGLGLMNQQQGVVEL
jgi:hypothetical protein